MLQRLLLQRTKKSPHGVTWIWERRDTGEQRKAPIRKASLYRQLLKQEHHRCSRHKQNMKLCDLHIEPGRDLYCALGLLQLKIAHVHHFICRKRHRKHSERATYGQSVAAQQGDFHVQTYHTRISFFTPPNTLNEAPLIPRLTVQTFMASCTSSWYMNVEKHT